MSEDKNSEIFALLQPELLTADQLISYLKSRCSNVQHLSSLSRERLVRLFRQVILPLPQRQCWASRKGKALAARRLKSSPEGKQENTSLRPGGIKRLPSGGDRLKPVPDTNTPNKVRITSTDSTSRGSDLDKIVIKDRRRPSDRREVHSNEAESTSKIYLKRSSSSVDKHEKCSTECSSGEPMKKQRTTIKWP